MRWGRDFDGALAASRASGKPVFLLFQEVPGCGGCQAFGRDVLSDPEVVRTIESEFIPLLIPNNQGGRDAEILRRFGEPAWNYQVVRFLDSNGRDLIPRKDLVWTKEALLPRMKEALRAAGKHSEANAGGGSPAATERAVFAQACFWTGEMRLGQIEGVVGTEAGYLDGREVTMVEFDPARVPFDELVRTAAEARCADAVYVTNPRQSELAEKAGSARVGVFDAGQYRRAPALDQKKQIQGTPLAGLRLSALQAAKVNAWIRVDPRRALGFLTPEQRKSVD